MILKPIRYSNYQGNETFIVIHVHVDADKTGTCDMSVMRTIKNVLQIL